MTDKQKQVNEMIAEIDQLADKLIKESKQLRMPQKIRKAILFLNKIQEYVKFNRGIKL